ncbi:MAG: hypothetical protein EPO68_08250 [Planctomycetota bacterium]|nr:MAG: hypothetical protein EPO68_08250 [Planctomycetota bacterium]
MSGRSHAVAAGRTRLVRTWHVVVASALVLTCAGLDLVIDALDAGAVTRHLSFGERLVTLRGPRGQSRLLVFDNEDVWSTSAFSRARLVSDDIGGGERMQPLDVVADRDGDGWQDYAALVGKKLDANRAELARAIVSSATGRVLWRSESIIRERSGPWVRHWSVGDSDGDGWPEWLEQTWRHPKEGEARGAGELALRRSSDAALVALRVLSTYERPMAGEDVDSDGVADLTVTSGGRLLLVSGRNLATLDATDTSVVLGQTQADRRSIAASAAGSRVVRLGAELHWIQVLVCGQQVVVRDMTPMTQALCWQTWIDTIDDSPYEAVIAVGGDVDRDGCPDVLVARPAFMFSDCVYTLSGRGGQLLRTDRVPDGEHTAWHFGTDLAVIGDVDGDGVDDYAASDVPQGSHRSGRVFVVSGADGEFLDAFGASRLSARRFGWK